MPDAERTELGDLQRPLSETSATFVFVRDSRLFTRRPAELRALEASRRVVRLTPNQLCRPPVPADVAVRLGQVRVTEFLPDGREVARAVLQAGSFFRTRTAPPSPATSSVLGRGHATAPAPAPGAQTGPRVHDLADIVLMALDEAELWLLPAGALDREAGGVGQSARSGRKGGGGS